MIPRSLAPAMLMLMAAAVSARAFDAMTPIGARLWFDGGMEDGRLIGRDGEAVVFQTTAAGRQLRIAAAAVERVYFEFDYGRSAVDEAVHGGDWHRAAQLMLPAVNPALPFLDLPDNNGLAIALELGRYLMRSAETLPPGEDGLLDRAARGRYTSAFHVFRAASDADWSDARRVPRIYAVQCLRALGHTDEAAARFARIDPPFPDDVGTGLFWLVQAGILWDRGETDAAMDAAVRSAVFEDKDIATFPDALLLTARGYETLEDWPRARDVYFEVARIFPGTAWAGEAVTRLRALRDAGRFEAAEQTAVLTTFFGLTEDMNARVNELLEKP